MKRMKSARKLLVAALLISGVAHAAPPIDTLEGDGSAIKSFDPVAYFVDSKPEKGSEKYAYRWNGAE